MTCLKLFSLVFLLTLANGLFGQNPNNWDTAWVNSYGGYNVDYGQDIKETGDKGFILVGTTSSFGYGNSSFYIIKTDSFGKHQWSKALGTDANDIAYSVALAKDGGYFFAGTSNWNSQKGYDGYLVKTDANGTALWTKNYGGDDWDFFYKACAMPDGGLMLCGETFSKTKGGSDAYLVRVNANGDTLWTKKIGGLGNDSFYGIERTNGRLYVVGKISDVSGKKSNAVLYKFDFNGLLLKSDVFTGNTPENMVYKDLSLTRTGHLLLAGIRSSDTSEHCVLRKIDTTLFSEVYYMTTNQTTHFNSVLEGNKGNMYVLGPARGGAGGLEALCFRFDSVFTQLNYTFFGGKNDEDGLEIIRTSKGYAMVGLTTTFGNRNNSKLENVFMVVTNKADLAPNYFNIVNEHFDELSPVDLREKFATTYSILKVYPNPVYENLNVDCSKLVKSKHHNLVIVDVLGKSVIEINATTTPEETKRINVSELKSGIYYLKLIADKQIVAVVKFVKK
jgi:hypothetical protein